jgi:hypothetical protein
MGCGVKSIIEIFFSISINFSGKSVEIGTISALKRTNPPCGGFEKFGRS